MQGDGSVVLFQLTKCWPWNKATRPDIKSHGKFNRWIFSMQRIMHLCTYDNVNLIDIPAHIFFPIKGKKFLPPFLFQASLLSRGKFALTLVVIRHLVQSTLKAAPLTQKHSWRKVVKRKRVQQQHYFWHSRTLNWSKQTNKKVGTKA